MEGKFRLLYSETSRNQVKKLHPRLRPIIKSKIEEIKEDPYTGKFLEKELAGYVSFRAKRYRIIYKILEKEKVVQIHYIGHRKDIYELFNEQMRGFIEK
ncbi:MAG: type II toxin-antitoxin system RelE/ParE family toxin [Deltaproteobacteria bacterium]|nr:type II toxin-antitoxin system RelE/ParE family toxin [Deltaproteobacteria bacterium]